MQQNRTADLDIGKNISKGVEQIKKVFSGDQDIISVILEDHKPLKELIKIMKDPEKSFADRTRAFKEFAPLLLTHAKAEEESLYEYMKSRPPLREDAFEGVTEHGIADQLCEEIKRTTLNDEVAARIKVLAEMVEHHIQEEERDVLPDAKEEIEKSVLVRLTRKYNDVQAEVISQGQDDAPHEAEIQESKQKH